MPKDILVYRGQSNASTSTTTLYTCPTNTVAEVRCDIRFLYFSGSASFRIMFNGSATQNPTSGIWNIISSISGSENMRDECIIYKSDFHILGRNSIYFPYAGDSTYNVNNGDGNSLYWRPLINSSQYYENSDILRSFKMAPKFYMAPGDKLKFNASENNSGVRMNYNFTVIEEASTLT